MAIQRSYTDVSANGVHKHLATVQQPIQQCYYNVISNDKRNTGINKVIARNGRAKGVHHGKSKRVYQ